MSLDQRESISRGLAEDRALVPIAAEVGGPISTVWRAVLCIGDASGYRLNVCGFPQQIFRRRLSELSDDEHLHVSHETVYSKLYVQTQPGLRAELTATLRTKRPSRHP
ncbi:hypothetical protein [Cryobacterium sp. Y29]|uniref:hypothetical protein n=1 Tax=Cryobacterium sp. Y29 TaxID=2048285 RepID=UPI000CE3DA35|nr:hypothetical protein [Cryobacterium sp. Y29]